MGFSRLEVSEKVLRVQEVRKWAFPDGKQIDGVSLQAGNEGIRFLCRPEMDEPVFLETGNEWGFLQMGDECTGFLQAGSEWMAGVFQRLDGNLFNILL